MRELYLSSPKMRSMPDSRISYWSRRLNFSSLGLYLVMDRSSLRQSYCSSGWEPEEEPSEDPEEEEEDDDSFLRESLDGFSSFCCGRYYFFSALAAGAVVAAFCCSSSFSFCFRSAAISNSFLLIFSCLASVLATRSRSSLSSRSAFSFSRCF